MPLSDYVLFRRVTRQELLMLLGCVCVGEESLNKKTLTWDNEAKVSVWLVEILRDSQTWSCQNTSYFPFLSLLSHSLSGDDDTELCSVKTTASLSFLDLDNRRTSTTLLQETG